MFDKNSTMEIGIYSNLILSSKEKEKYKNPNVITHEYETQGNI